MNINEWALSLIERNADIQNNPNAKTLIEVIRSNDEPRGIQIANNYLRSMGVSQREGVSQAMRFFGL